MVVGAVVGIEAVEVEEVHVDEVFNAAARIIYVGGFVHSTQQKVREQSGAASCLLCCVATGPNDRAIYRPTVGGLRGAAPATGSPDGLLFL